MDKLDDFERESLYDCLQGCIENCQDSDDPENEKVWQGIFDKLFT